MKDEWVISRVFQKSNSGGSTVSSSGGSKKTRISSANMGPYPEPSSPSSVYLPPLLESSPYANTISATSSTAASVALNDRDSCSYDSTTPREHVSCFSTMSSAAAASNNLNNSSFDFAFTQPTVSLDPFARFQSNVGVSAFPSLRSLQENLQLPLFYPPVAQPVPGSSNSVINACSLVGNWSVPE